MEGVGDDVIMSAMSSVDASSAVDSTTCVAGCVCFEGKDLADVHGGGGPAGEAGPDGAHGVHRGEGPDGASGPEGVGSHSLIAVVEVEQQVALDRLARRRERNV